MWHDATFQRLHCIDTILMITEPVRPILQGWDEHLKIFLSCWWLLIALMEPPSVYQVSIGLLNMKARKN